MRVLTGRMVVALLASGVAAVALGHQHVHWPLFALLVIGVLGVGACFDAAITGPTAWPEPELPARSEPDRALAHYVRVLEDAERSVAADDDRLHNLLRQIAGDRLRMRGLAWDSPEARTLLGDDLAQYLGAPPMRISRRMLRSHVERIELL
ncbi:hypothetical protein OH802_11580 [Nocardioides sp. NBC_00850]|uniref:hypothetical protein n=1 Tax=Nocardioides sp. NBC_00850 TaxID=2976001 RepID=UPI00386DD8EC|nr:hypothetical protein OH802_11580 [Nocardioides sp. NBC_00850]